MSNKNLVGFLMIALMLFAAFSLQAAALAEDFSVTSQKQQIDVCSCGLNADTYTLRNTGSVASTYQIFKSGSAAQYSTISENFFVLEPGEAKDVINYINLPCSAVGDYNEVINITTAFGLSKSFEQKVSAGRCANFEITPVESVKNSCPCSPVQYQIILKNTGSYDEIFDLNVTKYSEYAALSEKSVLLRPNENKNVVVYFNLPCDAYGEKNLSVDISAERSEYLAIVPLKLNIRECYDYSFESDSQFTVCEGETAASHVTVGNQADFGNTFDLGTNQKFVQIEDGSIFLMPNQSKITSLNIDATELTAGNYSFDIISTSEKGEAQKAIFASLFVEKCRDFIFNIIKPEGKIVSSKEYNYEIAIENFGTRTGTFNLQIEGPEWMTLEKNNTVIEPGKEGIVLLKANIPSDFSGKTYGRLTVNEEWLYDSQKIILNVIPIEKAYTANFNVINKAVRYDFSDVNVSIRNDGFEAATYSLSFEGSEWMSLSQDRVALAPGESTVISVKTSPGEDTPEGTYAAKLIASVPSAGVGYSTDFNVKLFSQTWYEKIYNFVVPFFAAYWLYVVIVVAAIVVLILLVFLIKRISKRIKEKRVLRKEMDAAKIIEEPPISKYQPAFQPFVIPTIVQEELPRLSVPKLREKKELNWARFFRVLFLIIVIAGVVSLVALNWGAIGGYFTGTANQTAEENQSSLAPELEINRSTGIEGEGNVVYIREEGLLEIPVIIKNRAPAKVVYTINNANTSWIKTDKSLLSLDVNESKTLNLLVNTTPELPDGTYEISLGLSINEQDLKYSEKIELKIEREKPLIQKYLPYIIAGIVLVAILIIILALTRKSRFDIKKAREDIKIQRVKERKFPWGLIGKIILIIVIVAIALGTYYYASTISQGTEGQEGSLDLGSAENQTVILDIGMNDKIIIPFIFSNGFGGPAAYDIEGSVDWIESTDSSFRLNPGAVAYVNVTAAPNDTAQEGLYNITISVKVSSEGISYVKNIILKLEQHSLLKSILENKFIVVGVAVVIIGLLLLLTFKKRRAEKRQFLAEIKQEIEMEKQKKVATRAPRTKIKLDSKKQK